MLILPNTPVGHHGNIDDTHRCVQMYNLISYNWLKL